MDSLLGVLKKTGFQPDDPSNAAHVLMLAWAWSHGTSRAEVLDNWYSGTQHQFSHVVPKGQTWLIGAESKNSGSDAVMLVKRGHPSPVPVAKAGGPPAWRGLAPMGKGQSSASMVAISICHR